MSLYVKRLASFLDFPSETVQDCIAGIIINTLIDGAPFSPYYIACLVLCLVCD